MVVEKAQGAQIEEEFVQQMKQLREIQRISQVELAARMVNAGWDYWRQTTVSRVEKFERIVRLGEAHDIAKILGIPLTGMLALDKEAQHQNIRAEVLRRDMDDWVDRLNGSVASFMEQLEEFRTTLNQTDTGKEGPVAPVMAKAPVNLPADQDREGGAVRQQQERAAREVLHQTARLRMQEASDDLRKAQARDALDPEA